MRLLVRAVWAFDDVPRGAEAWVEETPRVRGLVARGAFVVLDQEPDPEPEQEEDDEQAPAVDA
jgi:hypothetical protein